MREEQQVTPTTPLLYAILYLGIVMDYLSVLLRINVKVRPS